MGGTRFNALGGQDVYIAKRDRAGRVICSAHEGSAREDRALGLATDRDDNAIGLWFCLSRVPTFPTER